MTHALIAPILLPLAAAVLCLLLGNGAGNRSLRLISLGASLALALLAVHLPLLADDGVVRVYRLGNWPAPYGIVLVLDRLAAMMVVLTALLAVPALLYAMHGSEALGRHFHVLFQLQVAGLNGAFLTGDLFNLFVFFEILLLASYALLVHGGGLARARAGLSYVVVNLAGSALFLIALGLAYGSLGTLNLADVALVLATVPAHDQALVRVAMLLLVVVFVLKAAVLPLGLWLPHVYVAATTAVAALFAIMTKVGIYALLRVSAIGLSASPATADLLQPWLAPLAILTIAIGTLGALAAKRFAAIVANVVLISSGTLLAAIAALHVDATAAALYYLPQSTFVAAALFLLGDYIARRRAAAGDSLERGPSYVRCATIASAYIVLALAASGMPPLSGFLGKIMLMQSLAHSDYGPLLWGALLLAGLVLALVFARAGSSFFWESSRGKTPASAQQDPHPSRQGALALLLLVLASPLYTLAAAPLANYARAAAQQLHARDHYMAAVLGQRPEVQRERRP